ncbi:hypothetical protein BC943DRAFT_323327 [Umbelopsis sp. AD052]|nr:hypothetical protein BC943DRAFT_323327 [Umbelopsis sp. AD052]
MSMYQTKLRFISSRIPSLRPALRKPLYILPRYQSPLSTPTTRQVLRHDWHSTRLYSSQVDNVEANATIRQRLKSFMKKYGAVGAGVYLALSAVDLSLTMAVITFTGAEKVKQVEDWALKEVKGLFGIKHKITPKADSAEKPSMASIFVIAYGIHKTILLPVRLGLTAAITPFLARKLQQMGFRVPGTRKIAKT